MALPFKPLPNEIYQQWIEDILTESSDRLNDWENSFIESINEKLDNNYHLTQLQAEKLESLYVKYTK